jgi:fibronectin type 3 domain-containing protein
MRIKNPFLSTCTLLSMIIAFLAALGQAAEVKLAWDPSTGNPAGYKLYYGQASRSYQGAIDVGLNTTYTLSGLTDGQRYYFSATAYDTAGNESDHSNDVTTVIGNETSGPPTITSPAVGTVLATGQQVTAEGRGMNLSWSIDRIGDGLPAFATGSDSSISFTVPADATSRQKIRMLLTGDGGSDTKDYDIKASPAD